MISKILWIFLMINSVTLLCWSFEILILNGENFPLFIILQFMVKSKMLLLMYAFSAFLPWQKKCLWLQKMCPSLGRFDSLESLTWKSYKGSWWNVGGSTLVYARAWKNGHLSSCSSNEPMNVDSLIMTFTIVVQP
jgi:hypothetical protein